MKIQKKEKVLAQLYSKEFKEYNDLNKRLKLVNADDSLELMKLSILMAEKKQLLNAVITRYSGDISALMEKDTIQLLTNIPTHLIDIIFEKKKKNFFQYLLSSEVFYYYKDNGYHINEYKNMLFNCISHNLPAFLHLE